MQSAKLPPYPILKWGWPISLLTSEQNHQKIGNLGKLELVFISLHLFVWTATQWHCVPIAPWHRREKGKNGFWPQTWKWFYFLFIVYSLCVTHLLKVTEHISYTGYCFKHWRYRGKRSKVSNFMELVHLKLKEKNRIVHHRVGTCLKIQKFYKVTNENTKAHQDQDWWSN